jgi:hypothetical protein
MLQATDEDDSAPAAERHEPEFGLVSPVTGLANDYLNVFNEILLLLEFLPTMPEMTDDVLAWRPRTYLEHFEQSTLPDARHAVEAYAKVQPSLRKKLESVISRLNEIVSDAQSVVVRESAGSDYPDCIVETCETTAEAMRIGLAYANRLINEGGSSSAGASRSRNKNN